MKFVLSVVLAALAGSAAANPAPNPMEALVGMQYAKARKEIIDAGWRPNSRKAAQPWEQQLQSQFPELGSCSVDRPLCVHYFVAYDGACLKVTTEGEVVNSFKVRTVQKECAK